MDATLKEITRSLSVALEVTRLQQYEINGLKTMLFALRASVESGKPPLAFEDARNQEIQYLRETGRSVDDIIPLLSEHFEKIYGLSKKELSRRTPAKSRSKSRTVKKKR
jgi:hypothetical protein